jgi:hypothetical protein
MDKEVYTPEDILRIYLELACLEPDKNKWDEDWLQNNEPELFRFKMLKSLFRAFGLGDIKDFDQGTFIVKRKLEDYGFLTEKILSDLGPKPGHAYSQALDLSDIAFMFQTWLLQLQECEKIIKAYSWMIMVSEQTYYTFHKIKEVNMAIRNSTADMVAIMSSMISPSGKTFPKKELVRNFDFPDVDLFEIDVKWI